MQNPPPADSPGLLGGYKPVEQPNKHKQFQQVDAFIRGLRNGHLKDAKLHSLLIQAVNGFNYKATYVLGDETHQIVVYTPHTQMKPQLKAWDQIVSPTDPTIIKPVGCEVVHDATGKCQKCLPGHQLDKKTGECKPKTTDTAL